MRPLCLGMVGGGPTSGIGPMHRMSAALDGEFQLVAGAFSRDPGRNRETAASLRLDPARVYDDFREMARAEAAWTDGIDAVAVVTPNDGHAAIALAFIEAGIHVICEKPLATSTADALAVWRAGERRGVVVALVHNYACYTMTREARARVTGGEIGRVRVVQVEYASGGRSRLVEAEGDHRSAWRMDPAIAGPSSVLGDIGIHAHHLARFVTGLEIKAVSADITTFVPRRKGDDNAHVNLRFAEGARGQLWASVVAAGFGNGLRLRVVGEAGSLAWNQEAPDELWLARLDEPARLLRRGEAGMTATDRSKLGHPQGIVEAFANFYAGAARLIRGEAGAETEIATARDGVLGIAFVEACAASSAAGGDWTDATVEFEEEVSA